MACTQAGLYQRCSVQQNRFALRVSPLRPDTPTSNGLHRGIPPMRCVPLHAKHAIEQPAADTLARLVFEYRDALRFGLRGRARYDIDEPPHDVFARFGTPARGL